MKSNVRDQEPLALSLALTLLVLWVFANHPQNPATSHELALRTDFLHRGTNFHLLPLFFRTSDMRNCDL